MDKKLYYSTDFNKGLSLSNKIWNLICIFEKERSTYPLEQTSNAESFISYWKNEGYKTTPVILELIEKEINKSDKTDFYEINKLFTEITNQKDNFYK